MDKAKIEKIHREWLFRKGEKIANPVMFVGFGFNGNEYNAYCDLMLGKPDTWVGGLPVVDTECMVWFDDGRECWHKAYVLSHSPYEPNVIAVSLIGKHDRKIIWANDFKPLQSPRGKFIETFASNRGGLSTEMAENVYKILAELTTEQRESFFK